MNGCCDTARAGHRAGEGVTTIVTVAGAASCDFARPIFSLGLPGITLMASVPAVDAAGVRLRNGTAGAIDLSSGVLRVRVEKA
jgi:hypothetical protein